MPCFTVPRLTAYFTKDGQYIKKPEIKLPTSIGSKNLISWIKRIQKNIYFCFTDYIKTLAVWITTNCGKLLKEMEIPNYLTCLLRNLYTGQEANS